MFSHIPEEIFCPQVSGNINDALRVLKVTLEGPEKNAHFFDMELSLVDPENPVTQVSKTPSDEEFPWCGEDTDADIPSTTEDHEQFSKPMPVEELIMESDGDDLNNQNKRKDSGELGEKNEKAVEDYVDVPSNTEKTTEGNIIQDVSYVGADLNVTGENLAEKIDINEANNGENERNKNAELLEDKEGKMEDEYKTQDALDVPQQEQDPSPGASLLEDPNREKREKDEKTMVDYKNLAFPKRPRSMIKSELLVKDVKQFIEDMKMKTAPEDLDVRIIPSNMACRFELPIDLTRLKGECPLSYLRKYCRVTDSRKAVYREKFEQHNVEQPITVSSLRKIYENLYRQSGLRDEVMHLQRLLALDLSMELDVQTFTVVSCLMERIILKSQGRGPAQGYKKNIFEVTNFSALNGKLQGIEISSQMMSLLKYIRGT